MQEIIHIGFAGREIVKAIVSLAQGDIVGVGQKGSERYTQTGEC